MQAEHAAAQQILRQPYPVRSQQRTQCRQSPRQGSARQQKQVRCWQAKGVEEARE
ncbi:hypothetical protein ACFSC4_03340 [Deinococcus malanensis]|uniref:hypothetical protein n=1 Tax=Deinococcus malanensis TaxID=1706855 RepID=UPI00362EA393